eukprot:6430116-Heterocapsa_arctica.AAC.1
MSPSASSACWRMYAWWSYVARAFCHARNIKIGELVRVESTDSLKGAQMSETRQKLNAFLGLLLQLGSLSVDLDELAALESGVKSRVYHIKEVRVQNIVFPLRAARLE